jgi:hypothetical protein
MLRTSAIVFGLLALCARGFAQVPPGVPYDASKHPNPIVTYVSKSSFQAATYEEAKDIADIELIGLSQEEGRRESIEMAQPTLKKVKVGPRDVDVTFYPVIRQVFRLADGGAFTLHSFKFPRTAIPPQIAAQVLNEAAFLKTKKPEDARFGLAPLPEMLDIRGSEALLFDIDGELTVFWTEDGVVHTATAKIPQKDLFRLVEDLL